MSKFSMKQICKPLLQCRWPATYKNFPKQKNLSRTEQCYISRTAIKDRYSSWPVHCEMNHYTSCSQRQQV